MTQFELEGNIIENDGKVRFNVNHDLLTGYPKRFFKYSWTIENYDKQNNKYELYLHICEPMSTSNGITFMDNGTDYYATVQEENNKIKVSFSMGAIYE